MDSAFNRATTARVGRETQEWRIEEGIKLNKYTVDVGFFCRSFTTGRHSGGSHQALRGLLASSVIDRHSILLMSSLPAMCVQTQRGKLPPPVYLSDSERVKYMEKN